MLRRWNDARLVTIDTRFVERTFFVVKARMNGMPVGYANCDIKGNRLFICDIRVEAEAKFMKTRFEQLATACYLYPSRFPLRNLGIGTLILNEVLRQAGAKRVVEVFGCVVRGDLQETPHLLDWYRNRGFTISDPDGECGKLDALKKVLRRL